MRKNEQGFILPVTIAVSFLFFIIFSFQVNAYLTERAFSKETEELFILENLMQLGVEDVQEILQYEVESVDSTRTFNYPTGTIEYTITAQTLTTSQITLSCTTTSQRKYKAQFIYNHETKEIGSWFELR